MTPDSALSSQLAPLRIAWFSMVNKKDCPPGASVSACFTDLVLPLLREKYDIELFSDRSVVTAGGESRHYLQAFKRHKDKPFDIFFYQLEDRKEAGFLRFHQGLFPGITLFHNFIFLHDRPTPILNSPWEEVLRRVENPDLPWHDRKNWYDDREYENSGSEGYREAAYSAVSLFTSLRDMSEHGRLVKKSLSTLVSRKPASHFIHFPVKVSAGGKVVEPRKICLIGAPRVEHRIHKILAACSELTDTFSLVWLVEENELRRCHELLDEFGIRHCQLVVGRTPARWEDIVSPGSIAIHTLYSVHGSLWPYLAISLALGCHCLVSNFGEGEYLPDEAVYKIDPGKKESAQILELLKTLPGIKADTLKNDNWLHFLAPHAPEAVAAELALAFERYRDDIAALNHRWEQTELSARDEVFREIAGGQDRAVMNHLLYPAFKDLGWEIKGEKSE